MAFRIREVHEPPASCRGCRFYDKYQVDCKSVFWHLVKEQRNEKMHCLSHKPGPVSPCRGGKCYDCAPGLACND